MQKIQAVKKIKIRCMDYRENGQIDKEADSDPNAEVIRTAGGNADNVIPTLKRIVEEAKKNGDKVEVDVKLHTDCGAGKYSFSVLTQGIKAEPIIAKHIISRYNEWSVNRVEDMWSNNSAELHNRMLNNAFAKEIAEGVLKVKVGVDKTEEFNVPKEKREVRLIVSKTKRGVSYEEINGKLGFGAYAYYLHADSINEILPDILLAHMELKIVDIRFLSFSKEEDGQMEDWMSALGKDKHAKAAVITPERAHIFMRSESIPAE